MAGPLVAGRDALGRTMSKMKSPTGKDKERASATTVAKPQPGGKAVRETIESVVIAFLLAFLFRTFEAEAFVIPTGSMAPTLQGRHLDIDCPNCGYEYRAGATQNEDDAPRNHHQEIVAATCPMCRMAVDTKPDEDGRTEYPPYYGDRVLVAKFPYEFSEPQRWDVFVFKFPGKAWMNYIKRLVGLPNETLRIQHGDIYTRPLSEPQAEFGIARKPPGKLLAMLQPVYDNDYLVDSMTAAGWPLRWSSLDGADKNTWFSGDGGRSFSTAGKSDEVEWLGYRHFLPSPADWQTLNGGGSFAGKTPRPQLITDYYAYNDTYTRADLSGRMGADRSNAKLGIDWVRDLKLDAEVQIESQQGVLVLELVAGGRAFRCELDVATGKATLAVEGVADWGPSADTNVRGPGTHTIGFANVDQQLSLWIDGKHVEFEGAGEYAKLDNDNPTAADLTPARIGSRGLAVQVNHLKLWRDIYYIADKFFQFKNTPLICEYEDNSLLHELVMRASAADFREFFSNPEAWRPGPNGRTPFDERREVTFQLEADEFFALGDNSPCSADSRLWPQEHYVKRELLIGKAVFIYWPHAWPWKYSFPIRVGNGMDLYFPFTPNFRRMGFVR
jgi:signal peptidase I